MRVLCCDSVSPGKINSSEYFGDCRMFVALGLVIITALLRVSICRDLIIMADDTHLLDIDVVEAINKVVD